MNNSFGVSKIPHLITKLTNKVQNRSAKVQGLIKDLHNVIHKMQTISNQDQEIAQTLTELSDLAMNVKPEIDKYMQGRREHFEYHARRDYRAEKAKNETLQKENEQLRAELLGFSKIKAVLPKVKTLVIFDSIISAISNYSTDGLTCPDIELIFQSVLFPLVYEPVLKGNDDYYLATVPRIAEEVVRRGREYVYAIREEYPSTINTPFLWKSYAPKIQQWLIRDALPLIYGARDEAWVIESVYPYASMETWRDKPASRMLDLPIIYDGMELVSKYQSDVIAETGVSEFELATLSTRIEP